jgi:hypothetical protein
MVSARLLHPRPAQVEIDFAVEKMELPIGMV